ncbi:MAG: bifunctional riboflavin kinase/FAD synthetase [Alphaproteobacteria bacterium]|nr:bifunctional riboflavin kinase/FAD synthetase [Alphaproteobacteria bacterium]
MLIIRGHAGLAPSQRGAVVAIGNFDGVHRGHRAVIEATAAIARAERAPLGVLTFEPHPRAVLGAPAAPFRLTPLRIKAHAFKSLGVERLHLLHFTRALAAKTPEQFVREVLIEGVGAEHLVVGQDFAFGKSRAGNPALLRQVAGAAGVGVTVIAPQGEGQGKYSSSDARRLVGEGRIADAARILGRWFELEGRVAKGDQRGRTLGFPTANIGLKGLLHPVAGVYALYAGVDGGAGTVWHRAVGNLGKRPTFAGQEERLEVHLFDFAGDLYGRRLCFRFVAKLRPERKFDGLEALKAQIALDCREARAILARERPEGPSLERAETMVEQAST